MVNDKWNVKSWSIEEFYLEEQHMSQRTGTFHVLRGILLTAMVMVMWGSVPGHFATAAPPQDKRNILFIAVDDLRPELGCYGKSQIHSPNLDKLAAAGVLFERAYCQQAVCSPTRTSLLTGMRPDTTRVYDLVTHFRDHIPNVVTLPQLFKNNGYHTEGISKIYHGGYDDPSSWSIPHWDKMEGTAYQLPENLAIIQKLRAQAVADGLKGRELSQAVKGPAFECADVPDEAYKDGQTANHAKQRLQELAKGDKPFFLAVGFLKPHLPFIAPKKYWDLYQREKIQVPQWKTVPTDSPQYTLAGSGELLSYSNIERKLPVDDEVAKELIHGYYAAVSYVDAQIGKVIDELDRLGLRDNTIIVLWGDHGWKLGDYGQWCKHSNVEWDTRGCMMMSAPGMKGNGNKTHALVEFVDIYPTLAELAGLDAPRDLEGFSFVPVLENPKISWKKAAFSQYPRSGVMGYSMRTDRYRLTRWVDRKNITDIKAVELYDYETDPLATKNLAADSGYSAIVASLLQQSEAGWQNSLPHHQPQTKP